MRMALEISRELRQGADQSFELFCMLFHNAR